LNCEYKKPIWGLKPKTLASGRVKMFRAVVDYEPCPEEATRFLTMLGKPIIGYCKIHGARAKMDLDSVGDWDGE
jgi:hypothetical protein